MPVRCEDCSNIIPSNKVAHICYAPGIFVVNETQMAPICYCTKCAETNIFKCKKCDKDICDACVISCPVCSQQASDISCPTCSKESHGVCEECTGMCRGCQDYFCCLNEDGYCSKCNI